MSGNSYEEKALLNKCDFSAQWRRNEFESEGGGHRSGAKEGRTDPVQSAGKNFGRTPPLFFGSKSTISRFGERFCDGQYSFVSLYFFYSRCSPVPSHL